MKKYTQPITAVFVSELMHSLCASSDPTPKTITVTPSQMATTGAIGD